MNDEGYEGGGLNPARIIALSTAYWDSQTLLTANRLGLFARLAQEPATARQLADALGIREKGARMLLNACVALGLLQKNDDRYQNSAISDAFLTPGQPGYLGDAIRYSDDLYATWGKLQEALESGAPPMPRIAGRRSSIGPTGMSTGCAPSSSARS